MRKNKFKRIFFLFFKIKILKKNKRYYIGFVNREIISIKIYTDFAKTIDFKVVSIKTIQMIDLMLMKISTNFIEYDSNNIDFNILKNTGLFNSVKIYIYYNENFKYFVQSVSILEKYCDFKIVFFVKDNKEEIKLLKKIKLIKNYCIIYDKSLVSFDILEQIEKFNLNYKLKKIDLVNYQSLDLGLNFVNFNKNIEKVENFYILSKFYKENEKVFLKEFLYNENNSYYFETINFSKNSKIVLKIILNNVYMYRIKQGKLILFSPSKKLYIFTDLKVDKVLKFLDEVYIYFKLKDFKFKTYFTIVISQKDILLKSYNINGLNALKQSIQAFKNEFNIKILCDNYNFMKFFNREILLKIFIQRINKLKYTNNDFNFNSLNDVCRIAKKRVDFEKLYYFILNSIIGIKKDSNKIIYNKTNCIMNEKFSVEVDGKIINFMKTENTDKYVVNYKGIDYVNCNLLKIT